MDDLIRIELPAAENEAILRKRRIWTCREKPLSLF
jgi:hypothetical protein